MQYIIPIIFFITSGGIFFGFIDPLYNEIQVVRAQSDQLNDALNNTRRIQSIRDSLLDSFNTISTEDKKRLITILPDSIDNVRLILEIDKIAARYGVLVKEVSFFTKKLEEISFGPDEAPYGSIDLVFSLTGSYDSFRKFIEDLEKSLRIVDVTALSFKSFDEGIGVYTLGLRTYWLK